LFNTLALQHTKPFTVIRSTAAVLPPCLGKKDIETKFIESQQGAMPNEIRHGTILSTNKRTTSKTRLESQGFEIPPGF